MADAEMSNKKKKKTKAGEAGEVGAPFIPGLPDDLAVECLARVAEVSTLHSVSAAWRRLLTSDRQFRARRRQLGAALPQWLYLLLDTSTHGAAAATRDGGTAGILQWHAYDPRRCRWHRLPDMPHLSLQRHIPGFLGHTHPVQSTTDGRLLFLVAATRNSGAALHNGAPGESESGAAEHSTNTSTGDRGAARNGLEAALAAPLAFDPGTLTWRQLAPLTTRARRWCVAGAAAGRLLIASGSGGAGNSGGGWDPDLARAAELCDLPEAATWRRLSPLSNGKLSAEATAAVALDGKLHVASGRGVYGRTGVILDAAAESWRRMPDGMCSGWNGPAVAACGRIVALEEVAARLKSYDPATDTWRRIVRDERLRGMQHLAASASGKVVGAVDGVVRIVDIAQQPPAFFSVHPPLEGQIAGLQVLTSMLLAEEPG